MAATAYAIAMLELSFPFPLLPFLKFDLAEIPDTISLLLFGWKYGLLTAVAHWFALVVTASGLALSPPPIPQLMKLLAVLGMFLGISVAQHVYRNPRSEKRKIAVITSAGVVSRVLVMAPVVFILYYILFPETYLAFGKKVLTSVGIKVTGNLIAASLITLFTSIFNAVSAAYLIPLSYSITKAVRKATRQTYEEVSEIKEA